MRSKQTPELNLDPHKYSMFHMLGTAVVGASALLISCWGDSPTPIAERTCSVSSDTWADVPNAINTAVIAEKLGLPQAKVLDGLIGSVACKRGNERIAVPDGAIIDITGLQLSLPLLSRCITVLNDMRPPEEVFVDPKALCPAR